MANGTTSTSDPILCGKCETPIYVAEAGVLLNGMPGTTTGELVHEVTGTTDCPELAFKQGTIGDVVPVVDDSEFNL